MTKWSLLAAAFGILATALWTGHLARRKSGRSPMVYWLLGMAGLLPAWLLAFLRLIEGSAWMRPEKPLAVAWLLSSSSILLGVLVTDAVLRRLRESGRDLPPLRSWLLGVVALLPAWGIALLALTAREGAK